MTFGVVQKHAGVTGLGIGIMVAVALALSLTNIWAAVFVALFVARTGYY